jgi:integrase
MTALPEALKEYVALRRGLGAKFSIDESHLRRFVEFAAREGADVITTDLALRWATSLGRASARTRWARLGVVRRFAAWLSATEPRTEIPPKNLLPGRLTRKPPYIYSDEEIVRIVEAASRLASPTGLRALSFASLFGLLAVTGLRLSEALSLDRDDVDLQGGVLAVRLAKFRKSRFVPLHDSTCVALRHYTRERDRLLPRTDTPAYFVTERGTRVLGSNAEQTFAVVSRGVGLRPPAKKWDDRGHGPRLHDMRHRLAVRTLVRWYGEGKDVERELPKLVTYLGHAHVADTYWYFEAVPELLQLAGQRAAPAREVSL